MRKNILLIGFLFYPIFAFCINYSFTNGGGDRKWNNPNNWSPIGIPKTIVDNATFPNAPDSTHYVLLDTIINVNNVSFGSYRSMRGDSNLTVNGTFTWNGGGYIEGIGSITCNNVVFQSIYGHFLKKNLSTNSVTWTGGDIIISPNVTFIIAGLFTVNFGTTGTPTYYFNHLGGATTNFVSYSKTCNVGRINYLSPIRFQNSISFAAGWQEFHKPVSFLKPFTINQTTTLAIFDDTVSVKGIIGNGAVRIVNKLMTLDSFDVYGAFTGSLQVVNANLKIPNTINTTTNTLNIAITAEGSTVQYDGLDTLRVNTFANLHLNGVRSKTLGTGVIKAMTKLWIYNSDISSTVVTGPSSTTIIRSLPVPGQSSYVGINGYLHLNGSWQWEGQNDSILIHSGGVLNTIGNSFNWRADTVNLINNGGSILFNSDTKNIFNTNVNSTYIKTDYDLPNTNFTGGKFVLRKIPELTNNITISSGTSKGLTIWTDQFSISGKIILANSSKLYIQSASGIFKNDLDDLDYISNPYATGCLLNVYQYNGKGSEITFKKNANIGQIFTATYTKIIVDTGTVNLKTSQFIGTNFYSNSATAKINLTYSATFSVQDTIGIRMYVTGYDLILNDAKLVVNNNGFLSTSLNTVTAPRYDSSVKGTNVDLRGELYMSHNPYSYFKIYDVDTINYDLIQAYKQNIWEPTLFLLSLTSKVIKGRILGRLTVQTIENPNIEVRRVTPDYYGKITFSNNVTSTMDSRFDIIIGQNGYQDTILSNNIELNGSLYIDIASDATPGIYKIIKAYNNLTQNALTVYYNYSNVEPNSTTSPTNVFLRYTTNAVELEIHPLESHFSHQSGNWSDPATWHGNVVPDDTKNVFIAPGQIIHVDIETAMARSVQLGLGSHLIIEENKKLTIIEE